MKYPGVSTGDDDEELLIPEHILRSAKLDSWEDANPQPRRTQRNIARSVVLCCSAIAMGLAVALIISAASSWIIRNQFLFASPPPEQTSVEIAMEELIVYEIQKLQESELQPETPENEKSLDSLKDSMCYLVPNEQRFDCFPRGTPTEQSCEARGCCWEPPTVVAAKEAPIVGNKTNGLGIPLCYYPFDYPSYNLINYRMTANGFDGLLQRDSNAVNIYPKSVPLLQIQVFLETSARLRVKITDSENQRYEVPLPDLPDPPTSKAVNTLYDFKITRKPFSFQVRRKSSGTVTFDTSAGSLSFYDQFLEIASYLPSRHIYGLGEHTDAHFQHSVEWSQFTFWATDTGPWRGIPLYGTHPFYLNMETDGNSNGVFLFNSNAMDVILQPAPAITYRTIGGVLDFYFFLGPTPGDVVAQYIELIGKPTLPPYWSLGFHLCRWGYLTLNGTRKVTERNIAAGIPFDVQWNDIDYMKNYRDFTVDKANFDGIPQFVQELHNRGMHYVMITDPGISSIEPAGTYPPYDDGVAMNCFVKNASNQIIEGQVWTGSAQGYPDFTHPNASAYWSKEFLDFYTQAPIDGIWIDMNEPSNFITGSIYGCPVTELETPPYFPGLLGPTLATRTLCMTAKHHLGLHYNLHNTYGLFEAVASQNALLALFPNKRPFVLSRSTFTGQGRYSGHWSGDIYSDWSHLQSSIADILNFNMFGIPLVGADICGFSGNTTNELCQRWSEVGAFYPFARNHNNFGDMDQDPASFPQNIIDSTRKALLVRYQILPYFSSLFFRASVDGQTVVRPLFFQYPQDSATFSVDGQFMVGAGLMVSPVLTPNTTSILAYFPSDRWYDFYSGMEVETEGEWILLDAPMDHINVHVRGGSIIPMQFPNVTTTSSRRNPFQLLVGLDGNNSACGELFWDDGEQFDGLEKMNYTLVQFALVNNSLKSLVVLGAYKDLPVLGNVGVYGMAKPKSVMVNSRSVPFRFDDTNKALSIDSLTVNLLNVFEIMFQF